MASFAVVPSEKPTLNLRSIDLATNEATLIAEDLPLFLGPCLDAIAAHYIRVPVDLRVPPAPADLLVRHAWHYKHMRYGFHLAGFAAREFSEFYSNAYMLELGETFARLDDQQRLDVDRKLETLHSDDWEFGMLYRRWRGLRDDR